MWGHYCRTVLLVALLVGVLFVEVGGAKKGKMRKSNGARQPEAATGSDADLQTALEQEDPAGIDAAVAAGADINRLGGGGQTPLMASVLQGQTGNVIALLKHKPDASIGEDMGYTFFHAVGFQGRADLVKLGVEYGLDPLDRHADGWSGIHRACWGSEQRHTDTVEAFLEAGVPWDFASEEETWGTLKGSSVNKTDEFRIKYEELCI